MAGHGSPRATSLAAYVLHQYDWSESSLIVELFIRERGRVVVAAKGAKRPTSNFRPLLLPFQPLWVQLGRAPRDEQAEVLNLRSAEWAGGQPLLAPAALFSAYYLNELLLKLLPRQDAHARLYDAYAATVSALAAGDDEASVLRAFELLLLRELGWLPELGRDTQTAQLVRADGLYALRADGLYALRADGASALRPETGVVPHALGLRGSAWEALEAALQQADVRALQTVCSPLAGGLRGPLRTLLDYHLGTASLRTRDVRQGVQRLLESR